MTVKVEVRDGPADSYGKGRKVPMTFGELLDADSPNLYLTTQEAANGHVLAPPLSALADTPHPLPLRPALMGHLVPHSINLWLGRSVEPASSGLHHDFHDNLYVLLRGCKRFRLFSPADARNLYTAGAIARVHANGRISYRGEVPTTSDGRTPEDVAEAAMRRARRGLRRAERRLADAEAENEACGGGGDVVAEAAVERAEEELADAMERSVRTAQAHRRRRATAEAAAAAAAAAAADGDAAAPSTHLPPSFSRIGNLAGECGKLASPGASCSFPRLGRARMLEFELRAGEMLYLPAGWFHEVSSSGAHCALNYWYHPPRCESDDGPRSGGDEQPCFERPYGRASAFWEREWRSVRK